MAATEDPTDDKPDVTLHELTDTSPESIAEALGTAPFVTVVVRATGEHIAAAGTLVRALGKLDVPYQVRPVRTDVEVESVVDDVDPYSDTVIAGIGVELPEDTTPVQEPNLSHSQSPASRSPSQNQSTASPDAYDNPDASQESATPDAQNTPDEEETATAVDAHDTDPGSDESTEIDANPVPSESSGTGDASGEESSGRDAISESEAAAVVGEPQQSDPEPEPEPDPIPEEGDTGELDEGSGDKDEEDDDSLDETDASLFMDGGIVIDNTAGNHLGFELPTTDPTPLVASRIVDELQQYGEVGSDPAIVLAGIAASDKYTLSPADIERPDMIEKNDGWAGLAEVCRDAKERGFEKGPGFGIPTDDLADGLSHSLHIHTDFSGDVDAAVAELSEREFPVEPSDEDWRTLASEFVLDVTTQPGVRRDADVLNEFFGPVHLPDEDYEFATVEGIGDILKAVAAVEPGTAIAFASGYDVGMQAKKIWKETATDVHRFLEALPVSPDEPVFEVENDQELPHELVAQLARDFCVDTDIVAVTDSTVIAVAATEEADRGAEDVVDSVRESSGGFTFGGETVGRVEYPGPVSDARSRVIDSLSEQ